MMIYRIAAFAGVLLLCPCGAVAMGGEPVPTPTSGAQPTAAASSDPSLAAPPADGDGETSTPIDDFLPPSPNSTSPAGVHLADGSFVYSNTDFTIGDLQLVRSSVGGQKFVGGAPFGGRWTHNFNIYVAPNLATRCNVPGYSYCMRGYSPIVHIGTSASGQWIEDRSSNPPYLAQNNDDAFSEVLRHPTVTGPYTYFNKAGDRYDFSPTIPEASVVYSQRVTKITLADGTVRDFFYDTSARLVMVSSSRGYAILFEYSGSGPVSRACGFNMARVAVTPASTCAGADVVTSYVLNTASDPKTLTYTDPVGGMTTYRAKPGTASNTGWEITCIIPPGKSVCSVQNTYWTPTYGWMVASQTLADGSTYSYQYSGSFAKARYPEFFLDDEPTTYTTVTDPAQKVWSNTFVNSSPYSSTDPLGRTANYRYSGGFLYGSDPTNATHFGSQLDSVVDAEGIGSSYEYFGPRRSLTKVTTTPKPSSGQSSIIRTFGYIASCDNEADYRVCAKPTSMVDPMGRRTDWTYASHGGVLTEMQPAPLSGGARPLSVTSWTQRYAWVRNSGGALVQAPTPVWVKASETACQTLAGASPAASCDGSAPQTVTTYEHGAAGTGESLLVKGIAVSSGGTTLRTCYTYDQRARRISETLPAANLGSCP